MAIFPILVYIFLGTSRHNSVGSFSAVCIVLGKSVVALSTTSSGDMMARNLTVEDSKVPQSIHGDPIEIAAAVCLACGVIQLIMYACRFGAVCHLLSFPLISGFTTGAGFQVLTSQMKDLLGLPLPPIVGSFRLIRTYIAVYSNINQVNPVSLLLSIVTITLQLINVDYIQPKIVKYSRVPIPVELVVMISGIFLSRFFHLHEEFHIRTLGTIPTEFPSPAIPNVNLLRSVLMNAFMIAIVGYIMSIAKALPAARTNKYRIAFGQELLAMGASSIFASFFSCIPVAACPARSTTMVMFGAKSQIATLVTGVTMIVVLLWIGPLLEPLPVCVLAGFISVSLKGLLLQVMQFMGFWRKSFMDGIVWMGTFLTILVVSIDVGILVGLGLNSVSMIFRWTQTSTCQLGKVPNTIMFEDVEKYKGAITTLEVKIFRFCGSLNSISMINFRRRLYRAWDSDNERLRSNRYLVIDFTTLNDIDMMAEITMLSIINHFKALSIELVFIAENDSPIFEQIRSFSDQSQSMGCKIFPTIHEAVLHASPIF
ncbi:sulfate anion transporter 1-like isoform X2 [Malaya genurostris]|nr:sulfate anion transporter 1-like isoform X2 [Malaya genurostris]